MITTNTGFKTSLNVSNVNYLGRAMSKTLQTYTVIINIMKSTLKKSTTQGILLKSSKSCAAKRRDFGYPKAKRVDGLKTKQVKSLLIRMGQTIADICMKMSLAGMLMRSVTGINYRTTHPLIIG